MVIINDFPLNAEYWRAVDEFPKYEVSTDGRIRIAKTGKIMKTQIDRNGYIRTGLTKDGKSRSVSVHITVASAFCEKEEKQSGQEACEVQKDTSGTWDRAGER